MYPTPSLYPAGSLNMSSELIVNGVAYNVVQINGQKIAEATNYCGPSAPENAEVSVVSRLWRKAGNESFTPGHYISLRMYSSHCRSTSIIYLSTGQRRSFCRSSQCLDLL